jgi:pyridoxine 4-dehydrogenase
MNVCIISAEIEPSMLKRSVSIPVLAYSPICRGWLAGRYRTVDDLPKDMRSMFPRLKPEVFDQNAKLVDAVEKIAKRKGIATSQVAIAWVHRQGGIPIPGSTDAGRIAMNSKIVELTDEDMSEIQHAIDTNPIAGERYPAAHAKFLNA